MIRCLKCVMPPTRPDVPFVDGVCQACITYANRPQIDWDARKQELIALLERFGGRCIVPSSGGKDSTYQVMMLKELGADVTVVTATTCHLTKIGRMNIDNLARHARTIEVTPNRTVRAKLNRLGLEMVGDISWPEHVGIFTTPFRMAVSLNNPLIFYGENPQNQYGGPVGSDEARKLTARWRSEYGGFLGLRPVDLAAMTSAKAMQDYEMPPMEVLKDVEAHFLGQYLPWDSHKNAEVAKAAGMVQVLPSDANWWHHENLDNAQTGLHDHGMYRKFGFGRMCSQVSVDVRSGLMKRAHALELVEWRDGVFPETYAGVGIDEIIKPLGIDRKELFRLLERFTNWTLFDAAKTSPNNRPVLK